MASKGEYVEPTTKSVQLESSVALKIVQYASESYPNKVTGPLLGFDIYDDVLKITHAYQFPATSDDGYQNGYNNYNNNNTYVQRVNNKYQEDLLHELKETKLPVQVLGLYQSSISGKFISETTIETLANNQLKSSPNSILVTHDPSKAKYGVLQLNAYRLTKEFLQVYISNNYEVKNLDKFGLTHDNILEELPIKIHNHHLISLYLNGYDSNSFTNTTSLSSNEFKNKSIINNVENLIDSIDDLNNFHYQANKKKINNANAEINLQEWLPISQRINYISKDLEQQVTSQLLSDSTIRP